MGGNLVRWPACYDELWNRLCARHGKQNGTRAMVAVLVLGREFGHDRLRTAIMATVSLGACDVAAVRYLLTEASLQGRLPPDQCRRTGTLRPAACPVSPTPIHCSSPRRARGPRNRRSSQDGAMRRRFQDAADAPTIGGQFAGSPGRCPRGTIACWLPGGVTRRLVERESRAIGRLLHEARAAVKRRCVRIRPFRCLGRAAADAGRRRLRGQGRAGSAGSRGRYGKDPFGRGLCVAACRQRRRVRFTTATALINELAEAAHANQLSRALGRSERLDLICIDELGYVPLAETACELMFQVIADRAGKRR